MRVSSCDVVASNRHSLQRSSTNCALSWHLCLAQAVEFPSSIYRDTT